MIIIYLVLFSCTVTAVETCSRGILREIQSNIDGLKNLNHSVTLLTPINVDEGSCFLNKTEIFVQELKTLDNRNKDVIAIVSNLVLLKDTCEFTGSDCSSVAKISVRLLKFLDDLNRFIIAHIMSKCTKRRRRNLSRLRRN